MFEAFRETLEHSKSQILMRAANNPVVLKNCVESAALLLTTFNLVENDSELQGMTDVDQMALLLGLHIWFPAGL